MRIAFFTGVFPKLSETFVLDQITGLLDRGHDVEIFASRPEDDEGRVHPDVRDYDLLEKTHYWPEASAGGAADIARRVRRRLLQPWRLKADFSGLREMVQNAATELEAEQLKYVPKALVTAGRAEFDVIYCHFGHIALDALALRRLGAIDGKLVTVFHAYDITVFLLEQGRRVYDELLAEGDLFLPISEHWRERLVELGGDPDAVVVHHMGIDCDKFEFVPRTLGDYEAVRVVSIARLVEKKGLEYAISAIARVLEEHPESIEYHIAGDGPLREKLERLVNQMGISDQVIFHGWMDRGEILELLGRVHVMLAPSVTAANGDMEGIPVGLMECMARGIPVLTTRHSGIPELVEDGESGYLVPERDVAELADRLEKLVTEPEKWADMGRAGRKKVEEEFNIHTLNDRLDELLQEIASM